MIDNLPFIPGLTLSQRLYEEAVKPLMAAHFPHTPYAAGRLISGSEILGFDTPQSMDHNWGPRLLLFLGEENFEQERAEIDATLRQKLPLDICGYPTNFDYNEDGTTVMQPISEPPINHGIMFHTVRALCQRQLNIEPEQKLTAIDWLTIPQQILRVFSTGPVYHDDFRQLKALQKKLAYYPHDLWLHLMANQWQRISQEEAFVGRCGQVDDELGSRLVATRLIRDLMGLCFLIERQYAPYIKWFGTAFAQLDCAKQLTPIFTQVMSAEGWSEREKHLSQAYSIVAHMHNELGVTEPLLTQVSPFHGRPFDVIHAGNFAETIRAEIKEAELLALPQNVGSVDQFADSTDILSSTSLLMKLKSIYGA